MSSSMNRIEAAFDRRRREGGRSIVPFVVGGHPDLKATGAVIEALARQGAPVIEIGVPFSDPIADGPVISEAMREAIEHGVTPRSIFEWLPAVRRNVEAGIVLMVSASIVVRMGREAFVDAAEKAGVDGLVVPDDDLDEAPKFAETCRSRGLVLSMLVAPATGADRLRRIVACCSGFVYLLARQGVTGDTAGRTSSSAPSTPTQGAVEELARRVRDLRSLTPLPIACGFGISTPEQVAAVTAHADAAIVGSAFVRALSGAASPDDAARRAEALMKKLAAGLASPRDRRPAPA